MILASTPQPCSRQASSQPHHWKLWQGTRQGFWRGSSTQNASSTPATKSKAGSKSRPKITTPDTPVESATDAPTGATADASGANPEPAATDAHDAPVAPTKADKGARARKTSKTREPKPDLVVFAIRVEQAERDAIHKAAGPGKATRFVRTLAVAAATGDVDTVTAMAKAVRDQLAK